MKFKIIQKNTVISVITVSLVVFLLLAKPVGAIDWVHTIIGGLASGIVSVLGWVLSQLMKVLVFVAGYNHFIKSAAVSNGWVIARDVANMFFIVILLVIAFATILQIEQYNYKKWLPKLILMAILINFSKTICGILIDIAQVIMLTFVNAFIGITAGNLTTMLGIKDWQSLQTAPNQQAVSGWEAASVYILAVIYVIIALIVIAAMVGMLVMRIIMIWVYVVLSPFAYLLAAFPGGQKYASQWWGDFTKNLIIGPVLAFFIWLSFASLVDLNSNSNFDGIEGFMASEQATKMCQTDANGACVFGTSELMLKFIISIAMLLGGMKIAQEIGGAAGGMAGKIAGKGKGLALMGAGAVGGFALARAKWAGGKAKSAAVATGKMAGAGIGAGLGYLDRSLGNAIDRKKKTTNFADRGLVGTTVGAISGAAGRAKARIKTSLAGSVENQELDRARRNYFEAAKADPNNASMEYLGKKYKKDNQNRMVEVDDNGNLTNNVLKDSANRDVTAMTGSAAAWYDSKKKNFRDIRTSADTKQAESLETVGKKINISDMDTDEMTRRLKSAGTSAVEKMALAMELASKGAFKNKGDVDYAKQYLGGNKALSVKFNDAIDKSRPDLNYDLSTDLGKEMFKDRIDEGKIDSTKLSADAYKDKNVINSLKEYHGKDFGRVMETTYKRGKKYETATAEGLLKGRAPVDTNNLASMADDKNVTTHAKLTGKVQESFAYQNNAGQQRINGIALGKYVKSTEAKNINKINVNDYIAFNPVVQQAIYQNITNGQLTAMMKEGSNNDLVRKLRDDIMANLPGNNQVRQHVQNNLALNAL